HKEVFMDIPRFRRILLPLLAATCLLASTGSAQSSYTAQIRGTVTDKSGAVLPNAKITITNIGTNATVEAKTDSKGLYLLPALRPDKYVIRADAAGFRTQEKTGVVLQVDQQTTIDFVMSPATTSTTVEVTAAAPLLDTESASLGTDVTNEYVRDIPLYSRNAFGLVFLAG